MKRLLILFMILGLIAGSVTTAEAKRKIPKRLERTVKGSYGPYPAPVTGCNGVWDPFACMIVGTRSTESFFTAKVTDAHGQPVYVEVSGNGTGEIAFCGETTEPIQFQPGETLFFAVGLPIWPNSHFLLDCPARNVKTTGTISVTLSNLP